MMSAARILSLFLLFALIIIEAGCSQLQTTIPPDTQFPTQALALPASPDTLQPVEGEIRVSRTGGSAGGYITFSGTAGLPHGTILSSQLYQDNATLSWWPSDLEIPVEAGQWMVSVQSGGYKFLVGPTYRFRIWQKDHPEVTAGSEFDLVGPEATASWWNDFVDAIKRFLVAIFS